MSVDTTADDMIEVAKNAADTAIKALARIIVERCDGHDAYRTEYKECIRKAFDQLMDARENLDPS